MRLFFTRLFGIWFVIFFFGSLAVAADSTEYVSKKTQFVNGRVEEVMVLRTHDFPKDVDAACAKDAVAKGEAVCDLVYKKGYPVTFLAFPMSFRNTESTVTFARGSGFAVTSRPVSEKAPFRTIIFFLFPFSLALWFAIACSDSDWEEEDSPSARASFYVFLVSIAGSFLASIAVGQFFLGGDSLEFFCVALFAIVSGFFPLIFSPGFKGDSSAWRILIVVCSVALNIVAALLVFRVGWEVARMNEYLPLLAAMLLFSVPVFEFRMRTRGEDLVDGGPVESGPSRDKFSRQ